VISLKERTNRFEVSKINLELTVTLAKKVLVETGDLVIGKFPALEELAEIIDETLSNNEQNRRLLSSQQMLLSLPAQK